LEKVKDPKSSAWNEWLNYTNSVLQPYEDCDCYRYWKKTFKWNKHCENRYYQNDDDQHYVAFLTKFGNSPFHGHVLAPQVFRSNNNARTNTSTFNSTLRSYDWYYATWADLIDDYISKWNPKPDYFVFNSGHWKGHELRSNDVLESIRKSLHKAGIQGIYRTTTFRRDEPNYHDYKDSVYRRHDAKVCQYFNCLNVSWTATSPPEDYVDDVHFTANVNNRMNQQLLNEFLLI
jgi:hypothetical protein